MDAELKGKWVEALRSGEFKQGKGKLLDEHGRHCCLGVLCAVKGMPPDSFAEYRGSYNDILSEVPGNEIDILWNMNDAGGKSFAQIADYIEREL